MRPEEHPSRRSASLWVAAFTFGIASCALAIGCGGKGEGGSGTGTEPAPVAAVPAPTADTSQAAAGSAETIFQQRCALCHGSQGRGDGAAAAGLNPKPRNLRDPAYMKTRTDEQLLEVIRNGKGAMPAWGKTAVLTEDEIRSLVAFIRGLPPQP